MNRAIFMFCILIILQTGTLLGQWTQAGLHSDGIMSLAIGPNGYMYAGTYSNGLYRSVDSGKAWTPVLGPPTAYEIYSIAFDSSGGVLAGTYAAGLFRSTNNGDSWTSLSSDTGPNNLPIDDIYSIIVSQSGAIFVSDGVHSAGSIYRSTNLGTSWQQVQYGYYGFLSLAMSSSGRLYAGGGDGFYYSTNGGDNWTFLEGSSGLSGSPIFLAATDSNMVFAGTSGHGVYRSVNSGLNWTAASTGLTSDFLTALLLHDSILIAAVNNAGACVSYDYGANWYSISNDLTDLKVYSLLIVDTSIYVGTSAHGIWKQGLAEIVTSVSSHENELPRNILLEQNYPNPFNPSTTIQFTLSRSMEVELKIFDVLGREAAILLNERKPAGAHSVKWDASGLSSGMYFYRLQAGGKVQVKKLMLLK